MAFTELQNPTQRKQQYIDSIKFYLENTHVPVLFVENSGVDLSSDFTSYITSNRLEILTFEGNDYDKSLGKGYGEMLIIKYAVTNSTLLSKSDFLIKITGRYQVTNINYYLHDLDNSEHLELFVDILHSLTHADSRLWGCKVSFIPGYLLKYEESVNDAKMFIFENALCKAALAAIIDGYKFSYLKQRPRYIGVSGTSNTIMKETSIIWWLKNFKHKMRFKLMNSF